MDKKKKKILVVAAHPDDEVLGIGGTIIKHKKAGDDVYVAFLAQGIASRQQKQALAASTEKEIRMLRQQAVRSCETLGCKDLYFYDFPDNRMDSADLLDVIKAVEELLAKVSPDIIYTHHEYDLNIDHRICFQAVLTAARPVCSKASIFSFEVLSSTEWQSKSGNHQFQPGIYIDISLEMDQKISALEQYQTEIMKYPHPRSPHGVRILAQYRGLESGLEYAEAIHLVREIRR